MMEQLRNDPITPKRNVTNGTFHTSTLERGSSWMLIPNQWRCSLLSIAIIVTCLSAMA